MAMPAPDLFISKLGPESEPLLRNLLGYYIHDMAGRTVGRGEVNLMYLPRRARHST